jgi:hypothetical protein
MGEALQNTDRLLRARFASKHALFEPVALVLSLATVGTAFFPGRSLGGVSQRMMNLSAATGRRAPAPASNLQFRLQVVCSASISTRAPAPTNRWRGSIPDRFRGRRTAFGA